MKLKLIVPLVVVGVVGLIVAAFCLLNPFGGSAKCDDLVGSWSGNRGAELTFHKDGTLIAVNVPLRFSFPDDSPTEPFTGKGTWTLAEKPALDDQQIDLALGQDDGATRGLHLRVMGDEGRDGIYIPVSEDSAKKFTFKKTR
ncbi:hypothetical protein [Streptomyces sp. NPDC050485]|uniref:hypothetical protein n=1 Tax=Streptomyces sp. NPDC050485 TaxID=3365617 RepID=UPI0037B2641C